MRQYQSYIFGRFGKQYSSAGYAPREVNIVRSSVKKAAGEKVDEYKKEEGISQEAQKEIVDILMREKRKNRGNNV